MKKAVYLQSRLWPSCVAILLGMHISAAAGEDFKPEDCQVLGQSTDNRLVCYINLAKTLTMTLSHVPVNLPCMANVVVIALADDIRV